MAAVVLGAALILGLAIGGAPAQAQERGTTIVFAERSTQIADALARGQELEAQRRWGEALTYYEDAIRLFPNDEILHDRFDMARLHYDIGRRYADRSFCDAISNWSVDTALDVYAQVLLKIQSYYVDVPNWSGLVSRGTTALEVSLGEPNFCERNLPEGSRAASAEFCSQLRAALAARTIVTRRDAQEAVAFAAQYAQQQLHLNPTAVVLEYTCGATNSLDNYSSFLTADQLNETYSQIEGNFVGLGVELKTVNHALRIVNVITGSPAEAAGLRVSDEIVSVDGVATKDISGDRAANMLQGPEGAVVNLVVTSPGQTPRDLPIRRQRIDVPSVDRVALIDNQAGIGYLRLTCFQKTTSRDMDAALWKLQRDGMRSLIVDVRGNPGGLLLSSVEVADKFIQEGTIVSTRGRNLQEDFTYSAHVDGTWRVPLVVLIDQNSASAAEIFAGAIHDYHRGAVVGVRSFGKGSVQGIFPLEAQAVGLRLTTAKFFSPNGQAYSHQGVRPDVEVHSTSRPVDGQLSPTDDSVLSAALDIARRQALPR